MIRAKHGTPDAPYYWLEVSTEERRSTELGKHFAHTRLQLRIEHRRPDGDRRASCCTPTGAAIPRSAARRSPWCALPTSRAHPERFEREVVAEMLSRFDGPGRNRLWDAFGARFTGLSYREADHLSARNPRFIADLFPLGPGLRDALPRRGARGHRPSPTTTAQAAVRILEKVGFHDLNRVDPFDGGPYYGAARDAIASVRERRELVLPTVPAESRDGPGRSARPALGRRQPRASAPPCCRSTRRARPSSRPTCARRSGVGAGDRVAVTPLP